MDMIKVTAKTLDEAITKALIQLGTTSDNLDYTILEKGSSGFLGLFSKDVVIEAKKKRDNDLEMEDLFESIKAETQSVKEVKEPKKEKEVPKKEPKEPKKENKKQEPKAAEPKKAEQKHKGENKQKQEKGEKPEKPVKPEKTEKVEKAEKPEKPERPAKPEKPVNVEACDRSAKEFLSQVFKAMGIEVQVNTSFNESDRELTIDMSGADMGILIGKRGQTLDSLQYLVSLVVNKECDGYLRVKLDTENYRARRKETLETLAKNIAYKVKRTRRNVSLEPMNPYERRIIHAALQNDKYVVTRSEGEDPFRHVVVSLKREARERDNRGNRNNQQS
ncbi:MAG: KH domain-containing protein [Hungatella sp.]|nr:KH domain-containing protein [Hungatella sp.]